MTGFTSWPAYPQDVARNGSIVGKTRIIDRPVPKMSFVLPEVCYVATACLGIGHETENRQKIFLKYSGPLTSDKWKLGLDLMINPYAAIRVRVIRNLR